MLPSSVFAPLAEELRPAPAAESAFRSLVDLPGVVFLDSARRSLPLGRYSYLSADPFSRLRARGEVVELDGVRLAEKDPFAVLAGLLAVHRSDALPGLPPFQGGAAGLFGYDLCHHIERLPRPAHDEFESADLAVGLYDWVLAFDHATERAWLISHGLPEGSSEQRRRRAQTRMQQVKRWLARGEAAERPIAARSVTPICQHPLALAGVTSNFTRADFLEAIRQGIEYVHAGDCFQVNLAQRLMHPVSSPLGLYLRLRERNPAPFAGYFHADSEVIVSASPERFVRVHGDEVETRPIKGTRPRGATLEEDRANAQALERSPKDRAENVMIVDLLRNDLGRVCAYGSIRVEAVCRLESYQTVHHLVSEVRGRLRPGLGVVDLLRASFPGGSVTGAPKVRAMEIIAELEPTARGPYCGGLGWLGFDGGMDMNILIRTFAVGGGWARFPVGGGIVADSEPETEYQETLHKAAGLLRALG